MRKSCPTAVGAIEAQPCDTCSEISTLALAILSAIKCCVPRSAPAELIFDLFECFHDRSELFGVVLIVSGSLHCFACHGLWGLQPHSCGELFGTSGSSCPASSGRSRTPLSTFPTYSCNHDGCSADIRKQWVPAKQYFYEPRRFYNANNGNVDSIYISLRNFYYIQQRNWSDCHLFR